MSSSRVVMSPVSVTELYSSVLRYKQQQWYFTLYLLVKVYICLQLNVYTDSIASFHYGNWRAKGHVMWTLTNQQAAW